MGPTAENLIAKFDIFVEKERSRLKADDNNKFAASFGQITRYYGFLTLILERYDSVRNEFWMKLELLNPSLASSGSINQEHADLLKEIRRLDVTIQLEIESYYLFAKILFDKVARFIEFYFGRERSRSLDSHDQLTKNIKAYCKSKGLTTRRRLISSLQSLKRDIADFRDYQIAYEKSLRTVHGPSFSVKSYEASRIRNKIYPNKTHTQTQTKLLNELQSDIDSYLKEIMLLIRSNASRTHLRQRRNF